mgnify:CR=1 FL=1
MVDALRALSLVSIHAFRGEGDMRHLKRSHIASVSIHAFRGEGDQKSRAVFDACERFNPRLPGGRRPHATRSTIERYAVSIHAFRGEGDRYMDGFSSIQ